MGAAKKALRVSALPQVSVCEKIAGWRLTGCGLPSPLAHTGYRDEAFKINKTQHKCFDLGEHYYYILRYLKILKIQ